MKSIFTLPAILVFICTTIAIHSCSDETLTNDAPRLINLKPLNTSYFVGEIMDISITASDWDGTIALVEFWLNGISIGRLNSMPYEYSYEIKNMLPGVYNLEVVATDDQGEQGSCETLICILPDPKEFTDSRDGNTYRYVTIGTQTWMIDNLAFLPEVAPPTEGSESTPYYYVYDYNGNDVSAAKQTENYSKFGVLYNLEAAKQACPEGWHLPTESEWQNMREYIVNELNEDLGQNLIRISEGGTNHYGFSGVLAGARGSSNDRKYIPVMGRSPGVALQFSLLGESTFWWSYSDKNEGIAVDGSVELIVVDGFDESGWESHFADAGYSVRCIKD